MPKAYLTFAERERAKFEKERDKQINAISGVLASTKYTITAREIESKIKEKEEESENSSSFYSADDRSRTYTP